MNQPYNDENKEYPKANVDTWTGHKPYNHYANAICSGYIWLWQDLSNAWNGTAAFQDSKWNSSYGACNDVHES